MKKKITIQTECALCESYFPVTVNLNDFLQLHSGIFDESHQFQCPKCDVESLSKSCKLLKASTY